MASALQLAPRDVNVYISDTDFDAGTKITRVQSVSIPLRTVSEDVQELGSTDFWTVNGEPGVEAQITRNLIGDLVIPQAINSEFVSGDSLINMVWDDAGELLRKNIYMVGGYGEEIIWGAKDAYLSSVSYSFDAGGMASESWSFEGQEMTDDTELANHTSSTIAELTPAEGYGGIRHDKITVKLLNSNINNAISERITSVTINASVNRTALSELLAVEDGGSFGPYARLVNLPFEVSASISLLPSENFDKILTDLGSWNNPKTLAQSTAVLQVAVKRGDITTTYEIPRITRSDISYSADVGSGGAFTMTVRGLDVKITST